MRRIDVSSDGRVSVDGKETGEQFGLASEDDVTFPGVWLDGERQYDVEVWRDGALAAAVPPRSDDVDASFQEHERRRGSA